MNKIKQTIRIIAFLTIGVGIMFGCNYILRKPSDLIWKNDSMTTIYQNRGDCDVIFVGTSTTISNISLEELYLKYGIAGVTLGEPEQPMYLSYYSLKEALNYQKPQAVFIDAYALFYDEERLKSKILTSEEYYVHYSVDGIKNYRIKYEALKQAKELNPDLNIWNYLLPIYYNHSNWEQLTKDNFDRQQEKAITNGNLMLLSTWENMQGDSILSYNENTGDKLEISEINLKYLYKMHELCKQKGIPLILIRGGAAYTWEKYNAAAALADELKIPYLDLGNYEEQIGLDYQLDSIDGIHLNIRGANKWTTVLGNFLTQEFSFPDRRLDGGVERFEAQKEKYYAAVNAMEWKALLIEALSFDEYLDALNKIDDEDTAIFIAISDEGSANITKDEIRKLKALGLDADLKGKIRYSYAALVSAAETRELLSEQEASMEGQLGQGTNYRVVSGGFNSGVPASILINGQEKLQGGRGINIVVYNEAVQEVLSSVYFDTFSYKNPPVSRIGTVRQAQYAEELYRWKPLTEYQNGELQ